MTYVRFQDKKEAERGYPIILRAGTVVYTGDSTLYMVEDKSLEGLAKERIKFEVVRKNGNGKYHETK